MAQGSIYPYELADGTRRYLVMYRASNGVQRLKRGFSGRRDAERFLNKTMAAVDAGRVIATRRTFGDYVERWLEERRFRLEEPTYRDYRTHVERRLKPFFGEMRLEAVTPEDVRRYVAELRAGRAAGSRRSVGRVQAARLAAARLGEFTTADLTSSLGIVREAAHSLVRKLESDGTIERTDAGRASPGRGRTQVVFVAATALLSPPAAPRTDVIGAKTINNSVAVLRVALAHAQEDGLIARNAAASSPGARERITLPLDHREMDYLRLDEIPSYLAASSEPYRPLAEVLIACGLRISEAIDLDWPLVDFYAQVLRVLGSRKLGRQGGRGPREHQGRPLPLRRVRTAGRQRSPRPPGTADGARSRPAIRSRLQGSRRRSARPPGDQPRRPQGRPQAGGAPKLAAAARPPAHRRGVLARRRVAADLRPAPARPHLDHYDREAVRAPREKLPAGCRRGGSRRRSGRGASRPRSRR